MFLLALACADPTLAPEADPLASREVWLTAQPDEVYIRADGSTGRQLVYEDLVELPHDVREARLYVDTHWEGPPCGELDVVLGARGQTTSSQELLPWTEEADLAIQHTLDPSVYDEPFELFVASRAVHPAPCEVPRLSVEGLALVVTRGPAR